MLNSTFGNENEISVFMLNLWYHKKVAFIIYNSVDEYHLQIEVIF